MALPAGRYVFLDRRDKAYFFNLSTLIAFQTPNLLELEFGATIIADYTPDPGHEKENLNTNLDKRVSRNAAYPTTINATGTTTIDTSIISCFKIETSQITPGDPFAMTFDLKKEYFIYSVLLVQNVLNGILGSNNTVDLDKKHSTRIDVHIGPDPSWQNNPKCTLTPRLAADHKDSIKNWSYDGISGSGDEGAEVPDYGFLEWCNMPGQ